MNKKFLIIRIFLKSISKTRSHIQDSQIYLIYRHLGVFLT